MASGSLNVIALVSGGKDSFFSVLHCLANGHHVVALANLHPPEIEPSTTQSTTVVRGSRKHGSSADHRNDQHDHASGLEDQEDEVDLNSFMYQTVGHQAIPLYAEATGLPLFRRPIVGTTVQSGISYQDPRQPLPSPDDSSSRAVDAADSRPGPQSVIAGDAGLEDETESLVPLLRAVIAAHPEANALCTGAILSTYQRTRIESVALRLGLVPLAYLWQFPVLPTTDAAAPDSFHPDQLSTVKGSQIVNEDDDAQLLRDMAAVGLEARIVKVASAGLDEDFLWENVASEKSITRIKRALRRFGGGGRGSVLGEGGEFETLVTDGPPALFKGKIAVSDAGRRVVREGGGSTWLSIRNAHVEMKTLSPAAESVVGVRKPELLDTRFKHVLVELLADNSPEHDPQPDVFPRLALLRPEHSDATLQHDFTGAGEDLTVEEQSTELVGKIRGLGEPNLIINAVVVLRQMSDFPTINQIYGALFSRPNPPSRVTISCGDLLPKGSKIAIYITVQPGLTGSTRKGLHVQSRSYWAPANIGPYSQAITYPLGAREDDSSAADYSDTPRVVTIAGQIPLIPASMELPHSPDATPLQITLALQHLWRVGLELQTQWWSSAVAYFPRTQADDMRSKALLAARAWRAAHFWSTSAADEDDENGPDLWDRKYNPQYMSLTGTDDSAAAPALPAWNMLNGYDEDEDEDADGKAQRPLPLFFAAEVEDLPRGAGVEWHAHRGLVNVSSGSVHVVNTKEQSSCSYSRLKMQHVVVDSAEEAYIHTVAAVSFDMAEKDLDHDGVSKDVDADVKSSLAQLLVKDHLSLLRLHPYLTYVDARRFSHLGQAVAPRAIIPCHSLWNAQGESLHFVAAYQVHFKKQI